MRFLVHTSLPSLLTHSIHGILCAENQYKPDYLIADYRTGVYWTDVWSLTEDGLTSDHQEHGPADVLGDSCLANLGVLAPVWPRVLHGQVADDQGQVGENTRKLQPVFYLSGNGGAVQVKF